MKKIMVLLNLILMMSSCVSAVPVASHNRQRARIITSPPGRHAHQRRSPVVVKKVVVGTRVRVLPAKQVVIHFNNSPFIYAEGVFYRKLPSAEYEVVKPEIGMIVPQLPEYNVEKVYLKGETLFLFDGILYKQIPTSQGVQYKVTGFID